MVELGWPHIEGLEPRWTDGDLHILKARENDPWPALVYGRHSSLRNANPRLHAATLCGLGDWSSDYEGEHRRDEMFKVGMVAWSVFGWERVDKYGSWTNVV